MEGKEDEITIDKLVGCPRCELEHENIVFQQLKNPGLTSHWALCPTEKQPILVSIKIENN